MAIPLLSPNKSKIISLHRSSPLAFNSSRLLTLTEASFGRCNLRHLSPDYSYSIFSTHPNTRKRIKHHRQVRHIYSFINPILFGGGMILGIKVKVQRNYLDFLSLLKTPAMQGFWNQVRMKLGVVGTVLVSVLDYAMYCVVAHEGVFLSFFTTNMQLGF